ncbi:MAG: methyl-accepting chemotaxis protein [Gammaproteobacteria bacterium]
MKNMKLSTKITMSMLVVGILPLLIAGIVVLNTMSNSLKSSTYSQLESMRLNKAQQIEDYFSNIENQLTTLSNNVMTKEAINAFNYSFFADTDKFLGDSLNNYKESVESYYKEQFAKNYQVVNGESVDYTSVIPTSEYAIFHQYNYISNSEFNLGEKDKLNNSNNSPIYDNAHEKYHSTFKEFQHKFGYYDVFLVEPDNGYIVYSVFKELDYATSLIDGPYSSSGIAKAFKAAMKINESNVVVAEDYSPYIPSYNAPASFMASPIYDGENLLGVLIFQMPVDNINSVTNTIDGLGDTGQITLLGGDKLMRNQSRLIESSTLLTTKVDNDLVRKAFSGESGVNEYIDENGQSVLSAYAPLNLNTYDWVIQASINKDEAFIAMASLKTKLMQLALGLIVLVSVLAFFVMRGVSKQLGGDPSELLDIADDIVNGRFESAAADAHKDAKAVGVYAGMIKMQKTLRDSIEEDRAKTRRMERAKQALDNVSSSVVVTNVDLEIIYVNQRAISLFSKLESAFKRELPHFNAKSLIGSDIDVFFKEPGKQRAEFNVLSSSSVSDFLIGDHSIRMTLNPIIDEFNERIGTVIEWKDMTVEIAVENEVQALVESALHGDLSQRITLENKNGFTRRLSLGINELIGVSEAVINDTIRVLSAISHGDLNEKIESEYKGAFGKLKNDANSTVDKLTEIVGEIRNSSNLVSSAADEISNGTMNLSHRTEAQAANIEETSASMEEMTSSVKNNADNSRKANEFAIEASELASNSDSVMNDTMTAMSKINDASAKIADIIGVIDEIAFQTNLLALNAAVEAARAGEQGRGFAVVATEVRNLAGRSATAAKEIKELIEDSVDKVEEGSTLVNQSGRTLESIISSIKQVAELIGDITYASNEQANGIEQVNKAINSMDEATQNNSALVEQASAAAESMSEQSNELRQLVSFFKYNDSPSSALDVFSTNSSISDHRADLESTEIEFKRVAGNEF